METFHSLRQQHLFYFWKHFKNSYRNSANFHLLCSTHMSQKSFSSRMLVVIMWANNFTYYTMNVYQYYILKIVSLISIASNSMGFFFPFFLKREASLNFYSVKEYNHWKFYNRLQQFHGQGIFSEHQEHF